MAIMRTLIAISSCEYFEKAGLNDPMRETWLREATALGMDVKFFHGTGSTAKSDVVVLDVVDELYGLTEKLKAKCRWSLNQDYDFVFSCFPDTYARPERLLDCGYQIADYIGNIYKFPEGAPFCQGGPGYFLSKKACLILANEPSSYLNDDTWAGDMLDKWDIVRVDHRGFTALGPGPLKSNNTVTNHLSTQPGGFTGENMRAEHKRWLESL